jgi:hypothetical protein
MPNQQAANADATFALTRATLDAITLGNTTFEKKIAAGRITVHGDGRKLGELFSLFDTFTEDFNIVTSVSRTMTGRRSSTRWHTPRCCASWPRPRLLRAMGVLWLQLRERFH